MSKTFRDDSQNGLYRNAKTGKVVSVRYILHNYPSCDTISACFTGTRDGKPFGRAFSAPVEDFFARHMKAE